MADGGDVGKSGKIRCGGLPKKAWDFLASSDDEDNFFFFFFFVELFSLEREQNMAFLGATVFFAAVGPCRVMSLEKKRKKFHLKKRQRFRKNHRRGHRTRARARINITPQTYGTEEVYIYFFVRKNPSSRDCTGFRAHVPTSEGFEVTD